VDHQHELRAVLDSLQLGRVVLVGHDASGPDAIDFAVTEPGRVGQLVLLNTYYGHAPSLRLPEMIRLLADPSLTPLADAMIAEPGQRLWLLAHTGNQFGMDPADQGGIAVHSLLPQFFGDESQPEALAAIRAWTADLFPALEQQDTHIYAGDLAALNLPVTLVFGTADHYLSPDLARHLAGLFRHAEVRLIEGASHWPQWDRPAEVAKLILQTAGQLLRRHPALRAGPGSCSAKESWYRCGMAPNTADSRPGGQVEQRWAPLPVRIWEASSP